MRLEVVRGQADLISRPILVRQRERAEKVTHMFTIGLCSRSSESDSSSSASV